MLRSLALVSLAASLVSMGCSNNNNGNDMKPGIIAGGDMAVGGTGGNGGPDLSMPTSSGDMSGPMIPDLAGLPAPDHDPTQHPPLPRMTNPATPGVNTITAPEVWTVVWNGDKATIGKQVNDFVTWMMTSDYFKNGVKEYGVGAGVAKGVIELAAAPPATITQADLDALVDNNVGKGNWPAASANLVISLVLDPKTVVVQPGLPGQPDTPLSCAVFDGYHSVSQTAKVPYLVNAYCNNPQTMAPDFDNLTVTISHETAEAVTDFDLNSSRAVDPVTGMPYLGGGEDGDLCISLNTKIMADATHTYQVQRIYSDAAAALNNVNPCVPDDTAPFFGAGLYGTDAANPSVIQIPRTASKGSVTVKIEPFSYDPNFGAVGFYVVGSLLPAGVTLSPDIAVRTKNGMKMGSVAYGNPGSTTMLTVSVDSTFPAAQVGHPQTFLIIARNVTKTRYNIWWGTLVVTN